jgi:protein-L-isoaspartate(D-aspartate) O-methyltransferase
MSSPRVALLWPGTTGAAAGNFGVPQLVLLATWLRAKTRADVTIIDLQCERALGDISIPALLAGYDVIALGCYSSYDHLMCLALAEAARQVSPNAVIVAGGYHASARPDDIVFDGSPYDVCIVGEAEHPMVRIVESVAGGAPLRSVVLGPEAVMHLDDLPPSDWSFLERYKPIARHVASQAQIYLSRGCPFDCAFCMERAKREVSWRVLSVERAVDELKRLHAFLDLRTWTVYLADALFGMKTSWRKQFLEAIARENLPIEKLWLLIRVDLVDDEDIELFAKANCGLGFGLESGDPKLLATIRKAGRLDDYLDRMKRISVVAREKMVPWGANVIVGHPGETPATLATSAAYLRELFLDDKGVTGFLSVDPFRLYPGSPIDHDREHWERTYGTVFHRPTWWNDGDQEFLSEWVDPSSELTYRERERLQHDLLGPILREIPSRFVYEGNARPYFMRAIEGQLEPLTDRWRLAFAERHYAWNRYLGKSSRARSLRRTDAGLISVCRSMRERVVTRSDTLGDVLRDVARERFVPLDAVAKSVLDEPVALDETGMATVSAMHAYALSYELLNVVAGDTILDFGSGTGYGCALLSQLVGPSGHVYGIEIDPRLVNLAQEELGASTNVTVITGNATFANTWPVKLPVKITVGFALNEVPLDWAEYVGQGAVVVCPIREGDLQTLVRITFGDSITVERFHNVWYVSQRDSVLVPSNEKQTVQNSASSKRRKLPVV